jgi:hypothetical protein
MTGRTSATVSLDVIDDRAYLAMVLRLSSIVGSALNLLRLGSRARFCAGRDLPMFLGILAALSSRLVAILRAQLGLSIQPWPHLFR